MGKFQPIYTTIDNVKVRLAGKVQFQADPNQVIDGELPTDLLKQLIVDAETEVEQDLRSRYFVPFQSKRTGSFRDLPDHSQRALRVAVDLKAVMVILATDFGRGSHISGESYAEADKERYDEMINKLLGRDAIGRNDKIDRFKYSPPLDDVRLAATNSQADDGFRGMVINTDASDHGAESYAADQINNPAESYVARRPFRGGV